MKVLITGSQGFIGQNLVERINTLKGYEILEIDTHNNEEELYESILKSDIIFHLAGVNRPQNTEDFYKGNTQLTEKIVNILRHLNKKVPIIMSSSIQAELDNDYGKSKKAAEDIVLKFGLENKSTVVIYRFPNVFGKWSRPNYNSAVATFCYNISRNKDIWISDREKIINLVYIDDVLDEMISNLKQEKVIRGYRKVKIEYKKTLGEIADLIMSFKNSRDNLLLPNVEDEFIKKLYSTYLSFLPEDNFKYELKMNVDNRGSFTELLKSKDGGQFSVNISKPGITKGNHWHNTKVEKFIVVKGSALIKLRKVNSSKVIEYRVSDKKIEVVDIPSGYTHSIKNIGDEDMVTIMWANENFDEEKPDTIYLEV